jgi:stage III sporulation protein AE
MTGGDVSGFVNDQLSRFNTSGLNQSGLSFGELVQQAVSGELDLSLTGLLNLGTKALFNEFFINTSLIRQLLLVILISAVIGVLAEAFKHKGAGELGFSITLCMTGLLAVSSFRLCAGILSDLAGTMQTMMEASVPLMLSMMAVSGNPGGAAVLHPLLFFAMQLITRLITMIFIPLITIAACLHLINYIMDNNRLDKLARFLKKLADWSLKGLVAVFAFILTLQKISVPVINNAVLRTAKGAVGAVPVVGSALNAAVDTVLVWGQAAKSGVLVALVIVICAAIAAPVIKMLVLMLVYRLAAVVSQPLCDTRLVTCLEGVGEYMGSLVSAGALLGVAAVYTAVMLLSF